ERGEQVRAIGLSTYTQIRRAILLEGDRFALLACHGHEGGEIMLLDLEAPQEPRRLLQRYAEVTSWALDPAARRLAVGSADGLLALWDLAQERRILRLSAHQGAVRAAALYQQSRRAITAGEDGALCLWDLEAEQRLGVLEGHEGEVRVLAIS